MPLNANEEALLNQPLVDDVEYKHQRLVRSPLESSKIGKWSWVALILNRTIGSGIFLTPSRILAGTGCVGGALVVWATACVITLCGLYVWLECGLSMPQRRVRGELEPRGVPRSGGEKNFLEFIYSSNKLRTTCSFAIMYILLYNLGGNAIAFGLEVLIASGHYKPHEVPGRGPVLGIAVGVLTLVIVLHTFSRSGGIYINNAFAMFKVAFLLTIFFLGVAKAAGGLGGSGQVVHNNFTQEVWKGRSDISSWSNSLLLCTYAMSGWKQPFYILAETKSPRKHFPKYTVLAWAFSTLLYMLVNIAYLLVVDKSAILPSHPGGKLPHSTDLATLFFAHVFPHDSETAGRAMAALTAVSIFGTLWVMTFTASRIKQEVAKEGILPKSLYIAASYKTPYGLLKKALSRKSVPEEAIERAPLIAFGVHWMSSVLLVVVVAPIADPRKAYFVLVSLYAYSVNTLVGLAVAGGLLYIKLHKSQWHWQERRRYRPWISPVHAIIYALATAFLVITVFIPPSSTSPFAEASTGIPYYVVPSIALSAPLWGILWYWGLKLHEWRIGRQLVVRREAYWMQDPQDSKEYVQQAEIIDVTWQIKIRHEGSDDSRSTASAEDVKETSFMQLRRVASRPGDD